MVKWNISDSHSDSDRGLTGHRQILVWVLGGNTFYYNSDINMVEIHVMWRGLGGDSNSDMNGMGGDSDSQTVSIIFPMVCPWGLDSGNLQFGKLCFPMKILHYTYSPQTQKVLLSASSYSTCVLSFQSLEYAWLTHHWNIPDWPIIGIYLTDPSLEYTCLVLTDPSLEYTSLVLTDPSLEYTCLVLTDPSLEYTWLVLTDPSLEYTCLVLIDPLLEYTCLVLTDPS